MKSRRIRKQAVGLLVSAGVAVAGAGCGQATAPEGGGLRTVGQALQAPASKVRLIVEFEQAPAGVAEARARAAGHPFDLAAYEAGLIAQQEALLAELANREVAASLATSTGALPDGSSRTAPMRWTYGFNGLALDAPAEARALIASLPHVRNVHEDTPVHAFLAESVPYVNAPAVWNLGAKGEGQIIADIDTGIDWAHPMMTDDPSALPGPQHPKVKYYISYAAGAVTDDFGHGTHVGSTIAGDRSLGYSTGVFSELGDLGRSLFDGVAPKADLLGYKVLGTNGSGVTTSIVMAIDDAAQRRAHALNLSLGSTADDPNSANSKAVDNAMLSGSVVVVAAGNSGPGYRTIGTPATARLALTVGASTDPGDNKYFAYDVTDPSQRKMNLTVFSNSPLPPSPALELPYVFVGEGCTPLDYAGKAPVLGKIALIQRGTCTFTAKALIAQEQGAAAALIFNNVAGDYSGSMEKTRIMVGALSDENGAWLRSFVGLDGLSTHLVRLDPNPESQSGQVTGFSSRGPTKDYRIKPDVVAPGNTVTAATTKVGIPTASMVDPSGYTTAGGTSMATPHVAGAVALLRQLHPDWNPFDVRLALMNTARQLVDPADGKLYSIMDQGAGLIDVEAANATKGFLFVARPDLGAGVTEGSYSFGEVDNQGGILTRSVTFTLRDLSGASRTYALAFEPGDGKNRGGEGRALPADGFSAALSQAQVTVPANGEASFTLSFTVDGSRLPSGDYEGRLVATSADQVLRAPVFYRAVGKTLASLPAPELTGPGGSDTGSYTLSWTAAEGAVGYRLQEATSSAGIFSDGAESGLGGWVVDGSAGPASWVATDLRSSSGSLSFYAFQGPEQSNALRLAAPIQIPAGSGAMLAFSTYVDTEPGFDFGYVEASRDGAQWIAVASMDGFSGGWIRREVDLSGFSGGPLFLRFRYDSDSVIDLGMYEGWYVDDIALSLSDWKTVAEPSSTSYTVTRQGAGSYLYRVAGLFDTPVAQRAAGRFSNAVAVSVTLPDLALAPADLIISEERGAATITATVRNLGAAEARNAVVRFLVNGAPLGADQAVALIPAGGAATVSASWNTKKLKGDYTVTAVADPADALTELLENNNSASRTVMVKGNRVHNGGFEEGSAQPEGWSSSGATEYSADPANAAEGSRSAGVLGTGGPSLAAWTSAPIAVAAGELLFVSAQVREIQATSAPGMAVRFLGPAGEALSVLTVASGLGGTATSSLAGTVVAPAGATQMKVELRGFAATDLATGGAVYFDDVQVY